MIRDGANDLPKCNELYQMTDKKNVLLIDYLLSPREVRGLTKYAKFVITGRMHLAVMSLINFKPVIIFESQGKVKGLAELFQIQDLIFENDNIDSENFMKVVDDLIETFKRLLDNN